MKIDSLIFDNTSILNSKMMDIAQQKQKVLANNIANAETPGFIRKKLDFETKLSNAVSNGNINEVGELKAAVIDDTTAAPRTDGNNIILPNEMNEMMQNSVFYSLLSKSFKTRMNILKSAIKGS